MENARKKWESQELLAIEKASDRNLFDKKLRVTKEAAVLLTYNGFSTSVVICLHFLLASQNVEMTMSSAISELNGKEMMSLIRFLGLVLDEKLSSLVLHQEFQEELKYIEALVSSLASEVKFNCSVANIIETLTAEARAEQN
ncbi:hypothetical protein DKX38_018423 [Salix brachista]|uniref:Uncharacterized protein n=1 Tax=Salix brachista TaxID=2182728 RepID=A0A5N5KMZ5_9ROSI|nr:hypothetical protein DKX38_018423 [Salix brachista]